MDWWTRAGRRVLQFRRTGIGFTPTIPGTMTGDEARALRRGVGLSARQVAEELGVTESSVYRWEWLHEREVPRLFERALRDLVREVGRRRRGSIQQEDCG